MPLPALTLTGLDDGTPANEADTSVPLLELYGDVNDLMAGDRSWEQLRFGSQALTIASDAITATYTYVVVDTEGAAASDNLATINGGNEGDILILRMANAARVVTLKHGTGNVQLSNGLDVVLSATRVILLYRVAGNWSDVNIPAPSLANSNIWEARLTLETGVAISTSDQTAKATLYLTPYKGNRIALYSSSQWAIYTLTSDISVSLVGATADKNYDVFCYNNAGTPALEILVWTNDSTRATGLTMQDGVEVKSGDPTRVYVGTIRIVTAGGACEDSQRRRLVWNNRCRVRRHQFFREATSHAYTTATWRAWNNVATNRLEMVCGLVEDAWSLQFRGNQTGGSSATGIGLTHNAATSPLAVTTEHAPAGFASVASTNGTHQMDSSDVEALLGFNYATLMEIGAASANFNECLSSGAWSC